jgi:hypothetical protein
MWTFKTGDLIAKIHPLIDKPLQVGLVINHEKDTFLVKWISFNKVFFMEKEGDIFKELNNSYLLNTVQVYRRNMEANLSLLNSNYSNERTQPNRESPSADHKTAKWKNGC